jgi:multidrug efflux pump subunit AcrB
MNKIMNWFDRHTKSFQAITGIVTMLIAVAALIGVKVQIDASARLQREQSARDIYREFLNLSINQSKFAAPDYCAIRGSPDEAGYENYVQYMLYTSEQVLTALPDWETTMADHLNDHKELLCSESDWSGDTPQAQRLINRFRAKKCRAFKFSCS